MLKCYADPKYVSIFKPLQFTQYYRNPPVSWRNLASNNVRRPNPGSVWYGRAYCESKNGYRRRFSATETRTRFDELRHFVLLSCGCAEHMIMRRLPKHYQEAYSQLPLPLVNFFFPPSHICCQICFISRNPTFIVNSKSKNVLTLIANYISLKNKVSRDTIPNPHTGSSNIFECRQLFVKPLMRTSTVPAAIHILGNKYGSGSMSRGSKHMCSLIFYLP